MRFEERGKWKKVIEEEERECKLSLFTMKLRVMPACGLVYSMSIIDTIYNIVSPKKVSTNKSLVKLKPYYTVAETNNIVLCVTQLHIFASFGRKAGALE